jgi:hypothetical protein
MNQEKVVQTVEIVEKSARVESQEKPAPTMRIKSTLKAGRVLTKCD